MDIKKLIIGGITGGIVFFFLGWLFYDILLIKFLRHNPGSIGLIGRKEPLYLYLMAGQLLYGFLLAYILVKTNVSNVVGGLFTGAIAGFLMSAAVNFTMYGTSLIVSKKGLAADVFAATIIAAVAGAVIAAVTGRKQ